MSPRRTLLFWTHGDASNIQQRDAKVAPRSGELCGQNDGTNVWKYDHCPSGQVCSAVGSDFRCKNKKHHKEENKAGGYAGVADWGACTGGLKCQNPTSACVYYNQWYSQCTPGASNGVDDWGACTGGLKCKTSTSTCVYYNQWYSQCTPGASSGIDDWGACTGGLKCKTSTSVCVRYSQWYSQCKPATLPQGELCGQNDGTNVWKYDHCPSGQVCSAVGTDFRCKNKKHHKENDKESSCTITNESQCDGQNCELLVSVPYEQSALQILERLHIHNWVQNQVPLARFKILVQCKAFDAEEMSSLHLRIHAEKDGACTITNESQCNGQNWSGSTCCADSNYECRMSDDGQNVQRCQKKGGSTGTTGGGTTGGGTTGGGTTGGGGTVGDWGDCTGGKKCQSPTSVCVQHSQYYSQCKPATLGQGELCGQNDGTNVWKYDHCPSGQVCSAVGSDFRCKNKKHHKEENKAGGYAGVADWGACTGGLKCQNPTSACVYYNQWYSQCTPGASNGVDDWGACTGGLKCKTSTSTCVYYNQWYSQCTPGASSGIDDWGACTGGLKCKTSTSVCVRYSQWYSQCKPATLPQGELCGQNDGTNVWKYDHCPSGQTCKANGSDFRCA
ncbi:hypothetical protein BBJ28_00020237 [Nothophytophthora sp. Chile5]|nr:hypothetical protein BBJ28_00020237 [Nothophytophthora sp. Chile5]